MKVSGVSYAFGAIEDHRRYRRVPGLLQASGSEVKMTSDGVRRRGGVEGALYSNPGAITDPSNSHTEPYVPPVLQRSSN